ncbi:cobalamin B12-binding domain-containing protein [Saccharomonospora marina]|uniref:cobalamin B12-binding domain-containing protein n=1 Tax=Saccharomonospora marina TaxID=632569 RepID=UPI001E5FB967|nr:cobalamin B12-binding domain-containing protein [Saccharomonospora marina]
MSSVASDSHTWNLVFLHLLLEEIGFEVANLGASVPDDTLLSECTQLEPDLVVISSVNGHGYHDGIRVVRQLRSQPSLVNTPMVIGGKLGICGDLSPAEASSLIEAGFDAVFDDSSELASFTSFVCELPIRAAS